MLGGISSFVAFGPIGEMIVSNRTGKKLKI
jgi:hypothetical protein